MIEAENGANDNCIRCGKEIILDAADGYWDSFVNETNGIMHYSPECDDGHYHEPKNHVANKEGFYFVVEP
jgi:hypothetical protein